MSVLRIDRDSNRVRVTLDPELYGVTQRLIVCANERGSELDAELLVNRMQERLSLAIQGIARFNYLQGYRDGRSKRARKTEFSSGL